MDIHSYGGRSTLPRWKTFFFLLFLVYIWVMISNGIKMAVGRGEKHGSPYVGSLGRMRFFVGARFVG